MIDPTDLMFIPPRGLPGVVGPVTVLAIGLVVLVLVWWVEGPDSQ